MELFSSYYSVLLVIGIPGFGLKLFSYFSALRSILKSRHPEAKMPLKPALRGRARIHPAVREFKLFPETFNYVKIMMNNKSIAKQFGSSRPIPLAGD